MSQLTFADLTSLEPRLSDLLQEAQDHHAAAGPHFCANAVFYGYPGHRPGLKQRLSSLVGWSSGRNGLLGSSTAYDTAYHTIYAALPDCGEECFCQQVRRSCMLVGTLPLGIG